MGDRPDIDEQLSRTFENARRREDFDDFHNEMAGRETGRMRRFLSAEAHEERRGKRGSDGRAETLSRLQLLLASNPAYARIYQGTFDALRDAEDATERAMARLAAALQTAKTRLQQTRDSAARLPEGTRVFRDKHGRVVTEHGDPLPDEKAAAIHWRGDEPAYEQFLEERESVTDRVTRLEALQGYRVDTLGRIRDRMSDENNPPTSQELQRFDREIKEKMPEPVRRELAPPAAQTPIVTTSLTADDVPKL
ncbi:MAG: hypothetical protein KJ587_07275 [Alphaproteobacteria bacterium]|nr:hypothetical protein [Alphaproteobacteria bacterium]